jgi:hypothetical protein
LDKIPQSRGIFKIFTGVLELYSSKVEFGSRHDLGMRANASLRFSATIACQSFEGAILEQTLDNE